MLDDPSNALSLVLNVNNYACPHTLNLWGSSAIFIATPVTMKKSGFSRPCFTCTNVCDGVYPSILPDY